MLCPSEDELRALVGDRLAADDYDTVASHVEICRDCQSTLDRMSVETQTDTVEESEGESRSAGWNARADRYVRAICEFDQDGSAPNVVTSDSTTLATDGPNIDGYRVQSLIGRGGMGSVFRAIEIDLDREVALKVLDRAAPGQSADSVSRFTREAKITAKLNHPAIVPVYQIGLDDQARCYYTMRCVEGSTLKDVFALSRENKSGWNLPRAIAVMVRVCQSIAFAHQHGVIHRDLKPSNVMAGSLGEVYVLDWGLARDQTLTAEADVSDVASVLGHSESVEDDQQTVIIEASDAAAVDSHLTVDGSIIGTPAYMPPEQARGNQSEIGPHSDIYALGAMLFDLLTGHAPYRDEKRVRGALQIVEAVLSRPPTNVATLSPDTPPELVAICQKAMSRDIDDRYRTADLLAEDLQAYLDDRVVSVYNVGALAGLKLWVRRNRALSAAVGAAMVLAFVGLTATLYQQGRVNQTLTESNEAIALALIDEEAARKRADEASIEARTVSADMHTARGLAAQNSKEHSDALLWFAEAAERAEGVPTRQRLNHLRSRNAMYAATLPVGSLNAEQTSRVRFLAGKRLISVKTGDELAIVDWQSKGLQEPLRVPCSATATSPDGKILAVGRKNGLVQFYEIPSCRVVGECQLDKPVTAITCSSSHVWALAAGPVVRAWNGKQSRLSDSEVKIGHRIETLAFSLDGDMLVATSTNNMATVIRCSQRANVEYNFIGVVPHRLFRGRPYHVPTGPVFLDRGESIVTIAEDRKLSKYRIADDELVSVRDRTIETEHAISHLVAHPLGQRLIAVAHRHVAFLDSDLELQRVLLPHLNEVVEAIFYHIRDEYPRSALLTVGWDATARTSDFEWGGQVAAPLPHEKIVVHVAASSDSSLIATVDVDGLVRIWNRPPVEINETETTRWGATPRLSPDGSLVAPSRWHEDAESYPFQDLNNLRVLSTGSNTPAGPPIELDGYLIDSCVCADHKTVAAVWLNDPENPADEKTPDDTSNRETSFGLFDIPTGNPIYSTQLPSPAMSIDACPSDQKVAVLSEDELVVFNAFDGKRLFQLSHPNATGQANCVRFSPNGKKIIAHRNGWELEVIDTQTGAVLIESIKPDREGYFRTFKISEDGRWLAAGIVNNDSFVQVWDLATGAPASAPMDVPGSWWAIFAIDLSRDGRLLAYGGNQGDAYCWDWQAGRQTCPPMRTEEALHALVFTNNGELITAAGNLVQIWETTTGKRIAPSVDRSAPGDRIGFLSMKISRDGQHLLGGNARSLTLVTQPIDRWLQPPEQSIEQLRLLGELATGTEITLGDEKRISNIEWKQRWQQYQDLRNHK